MSLRGMLPRDRDLPGAQDVACPRCGGELEFARQPITGYTTERCIRHPSLGTPAADACHHLRTLGHRTPVVVVDDPEPARPKRECVGRGQRFTATHRAMAALLRRIPRARARALTRNELAAKTEQPASTVRYLLILLERDGVVACDWRARTGRCGRPAREYWRVS